MSVLIAMSPKIIHLPDSYHLSEISLVKIGIVTRAAPAVTPCMNLAQYK